MSLLSQGAVLLALATIGLTGCALTPATDRHLSTIAVPTQWQSSYRTATRDEASLVQWWRQFNDATLNQLIAESRRVSPDIRITISRVAESRARYGSEQAELFPSVNGTISGQGSKARNRQTSQTTRAEVYGSSIDASWEIDLFGRIRQTVAAARADLAESEENLGNAQATLAAEVASAYVAFRSYETQISVLERSIKTRSQTLQLTEWREKAGLASALDTQQSVSTLEQARSALPALYEALEQSRNKLALLCGKVPGELDLLLTTKGSVPRAAVSIAIGIPADTLRQRPDIRAAERSLEAAVARTRAAELRQFPSLSLSGSVGIEALSAGSLFSPQQSAVSLLVNLTAPIFNAGRIRSQIKIQSEQEEQAFIAYESAVLMALSEVENALISGQRNQERITVLDRAVAAARTAATLAEQQYQAGRVDLLVVLEAQRTLFSVEQQQVTTLADLAEAHIQLYKAVGGGWTNFSLSNGNQTTLPPDV